MIVFWRNKKQAKRLEVVERQASLVHKNNISRIKQTRKKVDRLNDVLSQNNIVFQLAHVTGHSR